MNSVHKVCSLKSSVVSVVSCLLYTSDAADERSSVDLGGRRIIKKKNNVNFGDLRNGLTTQQHKV